MSRMTPAKYVAEMKNATSGEVAPSASTSGVRPTPNALKEIVMPKSTPARPEDPVELRRWALDLLALADRWEEIKENK